jgi:hypothetical protein
MKKIKSKAQKRKLQKETYQNLYFKKKKKKGKNKTLGLMSQVQVLQKLDMQRGGCKPHNNGSKQQ